MEQEAIPKKNWKNYCKKNYFMLSIIAVSVLSIGMVTAAAVLLHSFDLEVTVDEPLSSSVATVFVQGYPGESGNASITITNDASRVYDACVVLDDGPDGIQFVDDTISDIESGTHDYIMEVEIGEDVPVGVHHINATLHRGDCP